ncbi:hypothetical protein [Arthrobacter sp. efr-133-R2A-120]|uniref:hypothetical protein n=1 Tax=Arthrobacter sp. efr-133-R2A-120 TaxID=3040277 RepID=UPI00254B6782|nr:hypothetical protein [Arthrobacter sp. efr-133-R2A-120]
MHHHTHTPSNAATESRNQAPDSLRYFGIATVCSDHANHDHALPEHVEWLTDVVSLTTNRSVRVTQEEAGLVRWFGVLNYHMDNERIHISAAEDATDEELDCLVQTALTPWDDFRPERWPAHPCVPGRKRIAVCRYIDDAYVDETIAAMTVQGLSLELHDCATERTA